MLFRSACPAFHPQFLQPMSVSPSPCPPTTRNPAMPATRCCKKGIAMKIRRIALALAACSALVSPAHAGSTVLQVYDAAGISRNIVVTTTTSTTLGYLYNQVICDATAGASCVKAAAANTISLTDVGLSVIDA